jgi:hypothetical protein
VSRRIFIALQTASQAAGRTERTTAARGVESGDGALLLSFTIPVLLTAIQNKPVHIQEAR